MLLMTKLLLNKGSLGCILVLLLVFGCSKEKKVINNKIIYNPCVEGNCENGLGTLYDPASYWGDREVDISMTKLFGNFNREFYNGYEEIWPLDKNSKDRTEIYNLYHLLNHANMFGGSYKESSLQILKNLRSRQ